MSYFLKKTTYGGSGKNKMDQDQKAAANYQMTPLFFQETLETSARNLSNSLDGSSLDFDENQGDVSQRSAASDATIKYRDTNVEAKEASQIMHVQSLASIINNPKKDSFLSKVKTLVK